MQITHQSTKEIRVDLDESSFYTKYVMANLINIMDYAWIHIELGDIAFWTHYTVGVFRHTNWP